MIRPDDPEPGQALLRLYPTAVQVGLVLAAIALLAMALPVRRRRSETNPIGSLPMLCGLAVVALTAVLGATAFTAILQSDAMQGWPLLAHVTAGGALCLMLAIAALTWVPVVIGRRLDGLGRLTASALLALAALCAISMLAGTFPLVGTLGMERLHDVHRWSGLATFVLSFFLWSRVARARRARQAAGQSHAKVAATTRP